MANSIELARIIQGISKDTFKLIDLLLNERKGMGISDYEHDVIKNIVDRIADNELPDYEKVIEEQAKKIQEMEETLFLQSFMLIDEESRNKVRDILKQNEELKAEIAFLKDKIQLIGNDEPTNERLSQVKASIIHKLVAENNRLKRENDEYRKLAELGKKMVEQQKKGRRKRKDIKDSEIKQLLSLGFNSHQIYRKFAVDEGKKVSFQTIRNRINAMKNKGVLP